MNVRIAAATCATTVLTVLALVLPARAQEPPPVYTAPLVWVEPTDSGGYRVEWRGGGPADYWFIRVAMGKLGADGRIDTQLRLDEYQLTMPGQIPGDRMSHDLPSQLPGVTAGGCTFISFRVFAFRGTSAPDPPGESAPYEICGSVPDKLIHFPGVDDGDTQAPDDGYTPPVVWVTRIDGGGYRVVWDGIGAADSWDVRAVIGEPDADGGIDAQRRLDEYQLAQDVSGADIWYDLPRDWTGMLAGGCTHAVFRVIAYAGTMRRDEPGESVAYEICDGIANKPVRFPALDAAPAVDPTPPAGVRLERIGTAWQLEWEHIAGAAYYDPGVLLFDKPWPADPTATGVGSIDLPLVAASERSVILAQRVTTDPPPPAGCYYALLMVFAVGQNGRVSAFPGNITERICTDGARIASFPATGAGAKPSRDVPAADVIAMLALAGGAALVMGSLGKRRR